MFDLVPERSMWVYQNIMVINTGCYHITTTRIFPPQTFMHERTSIINVAIIIMLKILLNCKLEECFTFFYY
jgi:hypothetical protein